jgi:hypothetical protein
MRDGGAPILNFGRIHPKVCELSCGLQRSSAPQADREEDGRVDSLIPGSSAFHDRAITRRGKFHRVDEVKV